MNTAGLFERFYYSRYGFCDGTAVFHRLCSRFIPTRSNLLEIGSGPANATSAYLASIATLVGVDVSEEILSNDALIAAHVYDGGRLPFEDCSFDACASNFVLEHIGRPLVHFTEVSRVLRPGGVYCFRTPNLFHYVPLAARALPAFAQHRLANRLRRLPDGAHDPYRVYYAANTRRRLRSLCAAAGLEVVSLETIEPEPSYGRASALLFFPMMAYERIVNSTPLLSDFRVSILAAVRKPQ